MGRYAGKQKRAQALQQSAMSVGSSNTSSSQQQQQHLSRDSSIRSPIDSHGAMMMPGQQGGGGGRPQPTPLIRASPSTSASAGAAKRNPYRRITKAVPPVPTPPGGAGAGGASSSTTTAGGGRAAAPRSSEQQQQYKQHHPPPLPQNYFNPHQPGASASDNLSASDSYGMVSGTTGTHTTHTTNTLSSGSQGSVDSILRNDRSGGSNSDHLAMVMRHSGSSRDIADYFASDDGSSSNSGCVTASTATVSTMQRKLLSSLSQSRMMMCANRRTNERTMSAAASILSAFSSGPEDDSDESEDDGSSTVPSKGDRSLETAGSSKESPSEDSLYRSRAATAENKAVGAAEASVAFETATAKGAALAAREQEELYRRRLEREAARDRQRRGERHDELGGERGGEETDHFDEETAGTTTSYSGTSSGDSRSTRSGYQYSGGGSRGSGSAGGSSFGDGGNSRGATSRSYMSGGSSYSDVGSYTSRDGGGSQTSGTISRSQYSSETSACSSLISGSSTASGSLLKLEHQDPGAVSAITDPSGLSSKHTSEGSDWNSCAASTAGSQSFSQAQDRMIASMMQQQQQQQRRSSSHNWSRDSSTMASSARDQKMGRKSPAMADDRSLQRVAPLPLHEEKIGAAAAAAHRPPSPKPPTPPNAAMPAAATAKSTSPNQPPPATPQARGQSPLLRTDTPARPQTRPATPPPTPAPPPAASAPVVPPAAAKAAAAARARAEAGRNQDRADQAEAMAAAARVREEAAAAQKAREEEVVEAARLHNQQRRSLTGGGATGAAPVQQQSSRVVPPPMTDAEVRAWHERKRANLNQMATMQTIHAGSGLQSQVSDITLPTVLIPPGGDSSECGDFESLVSSTHARSSDGGGGDVAGPSHPSPPPTGVVVGGVAVPVGGAHHHVAPSQVMPAVVEEDERRKSMLSRRTSLSGSRSSDYNSVVEKAAAAVAAVQSSAAPPTHRQQQPLHREATDDDVDVSVNDGRPKADDAGGNNNNNADPRVMPDRRQMSSMPPSCTPATSNSSASSSASSTPSGEDEAGGDGEDESLSTTEVDTPIETLSTHSKKSKSPQPPPPQQQPLYQEHQQEQWQRREAEMEQWKNNTQPHQQRQQPGRSKDKCDPLLPMDAIVVAKSEGGSTASPLSSRDSGGGRLQLDVLSNNNMVVGSARSVESPRAHLTRVAMLEQEKNNRRLMGDDVVGASEADAAGATPFGASPSTTPRLTPATNRACTWDPTRQRQESEQSMLTNEISENTSIHRNFAPQHPVAPKTTSMQVSEAAGVPVDADADAGAGIGISADVIATAKSSTDKGWSKNDDHASGAALVGGVASVAATASASRAANTEVGVEERSGEKMAQQPRLSQRSNQSQAGESSAEGSSDYASDHREGGSDEQPVHETQPEHGTAALAAAGGGDKREKVSEGAGSSGRIESDSSSSGDGSDSDEGSGRKQMKDKKECSTIMRAAAMIHGEFCIRSSVSTAQTEEIRRNLGDDDGSSSGSDGSDYHVEKQQDEDDEKISLDPDGVASLRDEEHERPLPQPLHMKHKEVVSTTAGMTSPERVRGRVDDEHSDHGSDESTNNQRHGASTAGTSAALVGAADEPRGAADGIGDDSSRSTVSGGSSRGADVAKTSSRDGAENAIVDEQQEESMWSVVDDVDDDGQAEERQQFSVQNIEDEEFYYSDDDEDLSPSKHKSQDQFFEEDDYDDKGRKSRQNGTREVPSGAEDEDSFLHSNDAKRKDAEKSPHPSSSPVTWMKNNKWYIVLFILIVAAIVVTVAVAVPMSKSDSSDEVVQSDEQSAPPPQATAGDNNVSPQEDVESGGDFFGSPKEPTYQYKEPMPDESFTSGAAFRAKSWQMVGADIFAASDSNRNRNGVHVPSQTGFAISMSKAGHRVAVGSRHDSSRGMDKAGSVSIYEFTPMLESGFWRSIGFIHGHFPGDQLGFSVSLSEAGDILAVGALGNDGNGDRSGQVRVFRYDSAGMQWIPYGQPLYGTNPLDLFGMSVSLSGSGRRLAVGSPYHDGDDADSSGGAVVFEYDAGADQWGEMLGSRQKGTGSQQYFGWSVSLSSDGNHLAVGAPNRGGLGYVRLYRISLSESSAWEYANTIESEDVGDDFGYSVSLSETGEVLAVGAPNGYKNGAASGYVAVYSNDVTSSSLRGDYIFGGNAGDGTGYAVDLSSNGLRVIIGSPSHDSNNGAKSGRGSVHQFNGRTWDSGIPVHGTAPHSEAGLDVAISASGTRFAMGLPHRYCTEKCGNGYVRVYE